MNKKSSAFSLVELIIVIAIVMLLAAVSVSYYNEYSESAALASAKTNIKIVNDAILRYFKENRVYPVSFDAISGYINQNPKTLLLSNLKPFDQNATIEVYATKDGDPPYLILTTDAAKLKWFKYEELPPQREFNKIRISFKNSYLD